MAKYLLQGNYTADGAKGLLKDGASGRKKAVEAAIKSVGGKLESMYFCVGERDVMLVVDVPDATAAVAVSVAVSSTGAVHTNLVQLLSVDEMDEACKKSVKYRAPGA
jgi:uncharacterized protein with GYD domain